MDSGSLNMLHKARNQHVLAVVDSVNFNLSALDILVYQHRVLYSLRKNDSHVLVDIRIIEGDYHVLTAKHIRRSEQHRIFERICSLERLLKSKYGEALRSGNIQTLEKVIEPLSVLRH